MFDRLFLEHILFVTFSKRLLTFQKCLLQRLREVINKVYVNVDQKFLRVVFFWFLNVIFNGPLTLKEVEHSFCVSTINIINTNSVSTWIC